MLADDEASTSIANELGPSEAMGLRNRSELSSDAQPLLGFEPIANQNENQVEIKQEVGATCVGQIETIIISDEENDLPVAKKIKTEPFAYDPFVAKLVKENRNLKIHVRALQSRILQSNSYSFEPAASSTMVKRDQEDSDEEDRNKENRH